jgi:hypothetical protein
MGAPTTTWYVAAAGSNSNNGTSPSTPFATVSKVASVGNQDDIIEINGGDTINDNASFTFGVTIQGYGTGQWTIAGGTAPCLIFANCGGITITNGILTNTSSAYTGQPIYGLLEIPTSGTTVYTNVTIENCTLTSGLQGIRIAHSTADNGGISGLTI